MNKDFTADDFEYIMLRLYFIITKFPTFIDLLNASAEKEKMGLPVFSPFLTLFSTLSKKNYIVLAKLKMSSAKAFDLHKAKTLSSGQELRDDNISDSSILENVADDKLTHSHTMEPFDAPGKQAF